jgi:hypothetical protein
MRVDADDDRTISDQQLSVTIDRHDHGYVSRIWFVAGSGSKKGQKHEKRGQDIHNMYYAYLPTTRRIVAF